MRAIRLTGISFVLTIFFSSISLASLTASASESQPVNTVTADSKDIKMIVEEAKQNPYFDVEIDGDSFVIQFTDATFYQATQEYQGLSVTGMPRSNRVNKTKSTEEYVKRTHSVLFGNI